MARFAVLFSAFLLLGTSMGRTLPRAELPVEKRSSVGDCEAVLIALKASSFCSSFVPITDSTVVVTRTAPPTTITSTINAPPCTTTGPPAAAITSTATTTSTQTSTVTTTTTVTAGAQKLKRDPDDLLAERAAQATQCAIKGLPVQLNTFTCDIIKQACQLFVKPKTTTRTTTVPGPTATVSTTVTKPCVVVTPTPTTTVTTTAKTTVTTTSTSTVTVQPTCGPSVKSNSSICDSSNFLETGCGDGSFCTPTLIKCYKACSEDQCFNDPSGTSKVYDSSDGSCAVGIGCESC